MDHPRRLFLSSYCDDFWDHRLEWFRMQADAGLLAEIDLEATGKGVIVCKDGFRAGRMTAADFDALLAGRGVACRTFEVDGSSLFCEVRVD